MHLHAAECQILVKPSPRGYWTDGDTIEGTVELDVRREVEVTTITVELCCEEQACVTYDTVDVNIIAAPTNVNTNYISQKVLLYSSEFTVFPDSQISQHLESEGYQIGRGQHHFDFKFDLPLDLSSLPCSLMAGSYNGFAWLLKAQVKRVAKLKQNYSTVANITVFPRRYAPPLDQHLGAAARTEHLEFNAHLEGSKTGVRGLFDHNHRQQVDVDFSARVNEPLQHIHPFQNPAITSIGINASVPDLTMISKFSLEIVRTITTTVNSHVAFSEVRTPLKVIEKGLVLAGSQDLTGLIADVDSLSGITENSKTTYHEVKHLLRFELTIASVHKPSHTRNLILTLPVDVMAITCEPHQPPPNYHGTVGEPTKQSAKVHYKPVNPPASP